MTCRHCHVDAGPDRTEQMSDDVIDAALRLLDASGARTVDLTGGAPELHPRFEALVDACVARGVHVIDRCNLTVLLLGRSAHLPAFLAERGVEVVASLPHWRRPNTDRQRGEGTYDRSIEAIRRLNDVGYGQGDPCRVLTLMHNPAGAFLPSGQAAMEREWKAGLAREHGVAFDRLIALNNMPIARFLEALVEQGNLERYLELLTAAFNPAAVGGLMCGNTLSVGWDGTIFDCDFNQMLDLPTAGRPTVFDVDAAALPGRRVVTRRHCFGCTAGAGSSCGGATT
jgi:radical SAM/Cys-rich protein